MGLHTHDFAEIFWVNEGTGLHLINGRRERLQAGDLWCIHPEDSHALEVSGGDSFAITNVAFPSEALEWMRTRYFSGQTRWFWTKERRGDRVDTARLHALNAAADQLAAAPRDRLHFEHFLLGVFSVLTGAREEEGLEGAPEWLAEACRGMRAAEAVREGVPAFFRFAGRSPEHVARVTRATLGITPSEYVNRLRIAQAAFQLRMTSRTVTEIALDAGYENLSHFFHVFRRLHGMSPRAYRERLATPQR
ncbi:MAG: AraC family transcriptional regulator [Rariglobus sp.]|jgi:AraC family cel operon transcriptional repressor|nr:AraC family transcriptional regulator [Rariglobus sp.]